MDTKAGGLRYAKQKNAQAKAHTQNQEDVCKNKGIHVQPRALKGKVEKIQYQGDIHNFEGLQ